MYCRSVCDKMSSCVVSYLKGVIRDESGKERTVSEVNYDAVSDYLNGLNAEGSAE